MTVHFVGAGPGDPELLTRKAERLLRAAPVCIYAGSLVAPEIVDLLAPACEAHDSAELSLEAMIEIMRDAHGRSLDVVRLHTGEPALYGAIAEQMRALDQLGIDYTQVPGISAWQAAAAALKTELTAPEVTQSVVLTRSEGRTPMPASETVEAFAATGATLCLYLSTHKLAELAGRVIPFYGPECPAAVVYHASWPDEQIFRGTLTTLPGMVAVTGITKTALIVIGPALAGAGAASKLYDATFTHEYRDGRAT